MKKRIVSMFLAAIMAFSTSAVVVSAEEIPVNEHMNYSSVQDSDNYFRFHENGNERLDDIGFFDFNITNVSGVNSRSFNVEQSSVNVAIIANAYDENDDSISNKTVTVFIMTAGSDSIAGVHSYPCDGQAHVETFSGLDLNTKYYIKISNLSTASRIEGSGRITHIKL